MQRTQDVHDVHLDGLTAASVKIIDKQTANWSRDGRQDLMTNWLSAGAPFDAVIANNDEMAIGAIQAMKAAGVDMKDVVVVGVDATQDALAAMQAGDLDVTVFQDAAGQGSGAVDAAVKLAKGEAVDQKVYIPFELVTPANIANYLAEELRSSRPDGLPGRRTSLPSPGDLSATGGTDHGAAYRRMESAD